MFAVRDRSTGSRLTSFNRVTVVAVSRICSRTVQKAKPASLSVVRQTAADSAKMIPDASLSIKGVLNALRDCRPVSGLVCYV